MIEPGIVTQDDFENLNEEVKLREITTPMRYRQPGMDHSVVRADAFDRLRDAYLAALEVPFVGTCSLCQGDINTAEQFLCKDVGKMLPQVTHVICDERRQARQSGLSAAALESKIRIMARAISYKDDQIIRLQTVLSNVKQALGNFGNLIATKIVEKETEYAISQRESSKEQGREGCELQSGGCCGEAAQASDSDYAVGSGEVKASQEGSGAVGYALDGHEVQWSESESRWLPTGRRRPYNFRIDDVAYGSKHQYKWPPTFKQYGSVTNSYPAPDCKNDPLGCRSQDDETLEQRFAIYTPEITPEIDNGLKDPPMYSLAYNAKDIQSCCE